MMSRLQSDAEPCVPQWGVFNIEDSVKTMLPDGSLGQTTKPAGAR